MARLSLRRRLPRAAAAWFAVAAACAGLAFVMVRDLSARAATGSPTPTVTIVVAAADLEAGTVLDADDLATTEVSEPAPIAALTDPSAAVGALAVTPFLAGEAMTNTRLAAPAGPLVARVPPGFLGVPVPVATLPGGLTPGDRVDVLATFTSARPYTTAVATDVAVLDVPAGSGSAFSAGEGATLLVLATPEVARQLVQASATGTLAVAVRGYEPVPVASGADG